MSELYESSQVGAFMYMWGYSDAKSGVSLTPGLLLNSQNPLDYLLGDLFVASNVEGSLQRRWFIAEFKRERSGFHREVHYEKLKPHRKALYQHLRKDDKCRQYARFGHFAIWGDEKDQLVVEPYAHAVGPGPAGGPESGFHELDSASFKGSFDTFYRDLHDANMDRFTQNRELYGAGLGLPANAIKEYLTCLLQFSLPLPTSPDIADQAANNILFGFTAADGSSGLALGSFDGLIASCARFSAMTKSGDISSAPTVERLERK